MMMQPPTCTTMMKIVAFLSYSVFNELHYLEVSATLKIAIFPYLRFQCFQIDMLEGFIFLKKSEENIISVERYQG